MSGIEEALGRVEQGEATVYDAEVLRQALAVKTVEVAALRQALGEARQSLVRLKEEIRVCQERLLEVKG